MAGIIGIYGLVVSVLISDGLKQADYALFTGFIQLGAGLAVGLAGMAAGFAIGIVGDAGVRGTAQQPRLFVGMILILIFAEVLGELFLATILHTVSTATSSVLSILTATYRSLRPYRRPSHELQGCHQRLLLSAQLATSAASQLWDAVARRLFMPSSKLQRIKSRSYSIRRAQLAIMGRFNLS